MFFLHLICEFKCEEHFISFEGLQGGGAEDFNVLKNKLQVVDIEVTDYNGQSYDGALNMWGIKYVGH